VSGRPLKGEPRGGAGITGCWDEAATLRQKSPAMLAAATTQRLTVERNLGITPRRNPGPVCSKSEYAETPAQIDSFLTQRPACPSSPAAMITKPSAVERRRHASGGAVCGDPSGERRPRRRCSAI
jgi:hypothetical protein